MNKGKRAQRVEKVESGNENSNAEVYAKNDLTEDEVMKIKEAFDLFDTEHSGTIDTNKFKQALLNGIDNQTLQNLINDIDKNQTDTINFEELIKIIAAVKMSDKDAPEDLKKIFDYLIEGYPDNLNRRKILEEVNKEVVDDHSAGVDINIFPDELKDKLTQNILKNQNLKLTHK